MFANYMVAGVTIRLQQTLARTGEARKAATGIELLLLFAPLLPRG